MTFDEMLDIWRFEYWASLTAGATWPTFYDFLLTRASRFVLSAHGIGRNIDREMEETHPCTCHITCPICGNATITFRVSKSLTSGGTRWAFSGATCRKCCTAMSGLLPR
jgi:hypothetical protein